MEISFEGIGQVAATFAVDGQIDAGAVVAMKSNSTVTKGSAGNIPCGVVLTADNGLAAVQIGGLAKVKYTGTALKVGMNMIACDGTGAVKTVAGDGISCLAVSVDTAGKTAVIKL